MESSCCHSSKRLVKRKRRRKRRRFFYQKVPRERNLLAWGDVDGVLLAVDSEGDLAHDVPGTVVDARLLKREMSKSRIAGALRRATLEGENASFQLFSRG